MLYIDLLVYIFGPEHMQLTFVVNSFLYRAQSGYNYDIKSEVQCMLTNSEGSHNTELCLLYGLLRWRDFRSYKEDYAFLYKKQPLCLLRFLIFDNERPFQSWQDFVSKDVAMRRMLGYDIKKGCEYIDVRIHKEHGVTVSEFLG